MLIGRLSCVFARKGFSDGSEIRTVLFVSTCINLVCSLLPVEIRNVYVNLLVENVYSRVSGVGGT